MTDLVRFVPICGFKSSTFYNFYYYPIEDINGQMDVIETMKKQKGKLMKAKGVVLRNEITWLHTSVYPSS